MEQLIIKNVTKHYDDIRAVDDISLSIPKGTFFCFLGPSGCGKTTLLRLIAGLETLDKGEIWFKGARLSDVPARMREIGMVFQSYSLFPHLNGRKNIAYGLECKKWQKPAIIKRVDEMLDLIQLNGYGDKMPHQLSGGQKQRIALARAIAPNPSLLLFDEPFSALDAKVREELRVEIRQLQRALGITSIMVTHDQEEALAVADTLVLMNQGKIEQIGTPTDLYHNPASLFVADFIGKMNLLEINKMQNDKPIFAGLPLDVSSRTINGKKHEGNISILGIRFEAVQIKTDEHTQNIIQGKVIEVAFLGNITQIGFLPDKEKSPISLELHNISVVPKIGDAFAVHLPANALRVLS